jgi:hypothetical protein
MTHVYRLPERTSEFRCLSRGCGRVYDDVIFERINIINLKK